MDWVLSRQVVQIVLNVQVLANTELPPSTCWFDPLPFSGQGEASWHWPCARRSGAGADKGGWDDPGGDGPADPHPGGDDWADQVLLFGASTLHWAYLEEAMPTKAGLHGIERRSITLLLALSMPHNGLGTLRLGPGQPLVLWVTLWWWVGVGWISPQFSPHNFWHQGPALWKTVCPRTGEG